MTGSVTESGREMYGLAVNYDVTWQYCCCDASCQAAVKSCFYVPSSGWCGTIAADKKSCSNVWTTGSLTPGTFAYHGAVYDYNIVTGGSVKSPADATVSVPCGNGVVDAGEQCDPNDPLLSSKDDCYVDGGQVFTAPPGDKGSLTCLDSTSNSPCTWKLTSTGKLDCRLSCTSNEECGEKRCCIAHAVPPEVSGPNSALKTCYPKDIYTPDPSYLCDPGTWMKCDESSIGSRQEFDGKTFVCAKENGVYKWVETTAKEQQDEGFVLGMASIFKGIVSFFGALFFI